jgi:hypothetical protein
VPASFSGRRGGLLIAASRHLPWKAPRGSRPAQWRWISRVSLTPQDGNGCRRNWFQMHVTWRAGPAHGGLAKRTAHAVSDISGRGAPSSLKQKRSDRHGYLSVSRRLDVEVHLLLRSRITHSDRQQPTARCGSSFPVSRIRAYRIVQSVYRALPCVVPNCRLLRFGVCGFHQSRNRTRILDRVIDQRIAVVTRNDLDDDSTRTGGITRSFCSSTVAQ